jgi:hypothetical protein
MFNFWNLDFKNLWYIGGGSEYDPGAYDDRLTRGGPLGKQPTQYGGYLYGGSDSRKPISFTWNADYYGDPNGGYAKDLSGGLSWRPSASVLLSVSPALRLFRNTIQYVQAVTDPLATNTYGRRYVFADIYQTTLSATTRISWTLSPQLSFQLYAQPFASSGDYRNFKELAKPATNRYTTYGKSGTSSVTTVRSGSTVTSYTVDPDGTGPATSFTINNPDFRVQSLRGNAVMRWEYRPGSAIFFVWQQQRSAFEPFVGDFRTGRDLGDIFGQPSNVFLVKATYWFAR